MVFCKHCGEEALGEHLRELPIKAPSRKGITNKQKTVETRALNPDENRRYYGDIKVGDVLKFINEDNNEIMY